MNRTEDVRIPRDQNGHENSAAPDDYDLNDIDIAWCPGCGNFSILTSLKNALHELELAPGRVVVVSGIGQAAKLPQYLRCNMFNGLHGRALPPATAIKSCNPSLTVIAESGDGDMYGEGGNHFMHTIRRNPDITNIVHNNMVYGLTKGQASPTSQPGFKTPVQLHGVTSEPFNPLAVAIALNASFVARCFAGDQKHTTEILKQALTNRGYSLVDILQPCVSFNKINTYQWFTDHTKPLTDHDPHDRIHAFGLALQDDPLLLGVFYQRSKSTFTEATGIYGDNESPLYSREVDLKKLQNLIDEKRTG